MAKKTAKKSAAKKSKKAETSPAKKKKSAPAAKKTTKKTTKKRVSRKKKVVVVRHKLYWGVFTHAMKRVALYEFNQKKAAEKKAKELTDAGKPQHFVMRVKEPIEEAAAEE